MIRSDSHKEIFGSNNQMQPEDFLDGTSARTRPISYDDIMLRRKNKGDTALQVSSISGADGSELAQDNMERASDIPEGHPRINDNSKSVGENRNSNDSKKVRSGRKADTNVSIKNENSVQENDDRSLFPDIKSKDKGDRNVRRNRAPEEKAEGRNHGRRKKDDLLSVTPDNGPDKRKDSDLYKQERVSERSRVKSEIVKTQPHNEERQVYRKRKTDEWTGSDSDNDYKKRNVRNMRQTDNLTAKGSEKSLKEKKHKHHPEEDKSRGRNIGKKNDSERKGLLPTRTYVEESRSKRRRSRSRDREKDRGRRSLSQSPKAYKNTSIDKRELLQGPQLSSHSTKDKSGREPPELLSHSTKDKSGREPPELLSHSTKDKSGREHSIVDSKRVSSNGSNSHYRRNTNSSSGLGGYSPRKRKTDAAAKTPSPTRRSPERRNAGWDLQPVEKESIMTSTVSNLNTASQKLSFNIKEFPSITPVAPVVKPIGISLHTLSSQMRAIESIQLTQATRPKRRLYVENLPVSTSEKNLIECINKLLLSSGVNYIQGTQPCISCILHREKSQALLEFLTPEDASAALCLDGMSFSGSNLKLRRPKDYANVTTGLPNKLVGAVDSISDTVEDSPNKIFIGGISKLFSSRMLLEIARPFGPVKAFHFEFIADSNEPCAFLEYVDHSVTSKACAGLNGMRLGGQVLTAALATPGPVLEIVGKLPTYVIPDHAKPLIKKPTAILKLKNVLDPECLISLSESDLEEILDDIRLECSRFGMVRSVNFANKTNALSLMEANEIKNASACNDAYNLHFENRSCRIDQLTKSSSGPKELGNNSQTLEDINVCDNIAGLSDTLGGSFEHKVISRSILVGETLSNEIVAGNITKGVVCELPSNGEDGSAEEPPSESNPGDFSGEFGYQQNTSDVELVSNCSNAGSTSMIDYELENEPSTEEDLKSEEHNGKSVSLKEDLEIEEKIYANNVELDSIKGKESDPLEEGDGKDVSVDVGHIFEPGSVIVEYRRPEAACMAAHCLHGRMFDGRVVTVEYVGHDLYRMGFHRCELCRN